ncbi:NUDIX hydrolase [Undibacterium sp. CY18W]|uniref:NUDIX hydrolase n=1 Tax=Undibacterium hunanense TaxID=2762292 RepID=A0ABR6ZN30_9BURK|nr:NUDIX domain-containing protein [Undibacterium hunanense]MBC3916994.1 NUDIX hydrolase [Undibacterium hunanense]
MAVSKKDSEEQEFLRQYNIHDYDIPLTSVDLVIFTIRDNLLQVLLVKRGDHPYKGKWALPGGFIDVQRDTNLDATALRKLREKTGVEAPYLEQLQGFGSKDRDPRGWSSTFVYFALISSETVELRHGAGADEAVWYPLEGQNAQKPVVKLAFDHSAILELALQRLRSKVEYTSLPAYLLPAEFTLSELQQVYEIILGRPLDKSSFRKRIKEGDFLDELPGRQRLGSNRPAQLFAVRAGLASASFNPLSRA